jgi:hypothetical protein
VSDQAARKRIREAALVAERGNVGVQDDPGHDLCHVLVTKPIQVRKELVELVVGLEYIGSQLVD